jgi:hypothetical protein
MLSRMGMRKHTTPQEDFMSRLLAALGTAGLIAVASAMPAASAPVVSPITGVTTSDVIAVQAKKKEAKKAPAKKKAAKKKAPAKKAAPKKAAKS